MFNDSSETPQYPWVCGLSALTLYLPFQTSDDFGIDSTNHTYRFQSTHTHTPPGLVHTVVNDRPFYKNRTARTGSSDSVDCEFRVRWRRLDLSVGCVLSMARGNPESHQNPQFGG